MLVVFDFETGGLKDHHPNIQLAAIAVDRRWGELDCFEQKIQFDPETADSEALELNSYDPSLWTSARPEPNVIGDFCDWLRNWSCVTKVSRRGKEYWVARLCGHNAARFDYPRLKAACDRAGGIFLPADWHVLDTMQGAAWHCQRNGRWPQSLRLDSVCRHLGVPVADSHDALGDCRMTVQLARKLLTGE